MTEVTPTARNAWSDTVGGSCQSPLLLFVGSSPPLLVRDRPLDDGGPSSPLNVGGSIPLWCRSRSPSPGRGLLLPTLVVGSSSRLSVESRLLLGGSIPPLLAARCSCSRGERRVPGVSAAPSLRLVGRPASESRRSRAKPPPPGWRLDALARLGMAAAPSAAGCSPERSRSRANRGIVGGGGAAGLE